MPTQKRRISITVDDEMWEMLMSYRNRGKFMSVSAAALDLIERGVDAHESKPKPVLTIAAHADNLPDDDKKQKAIERAAQKAMSKYWGADDDDGDGED